MFHVKDGWFFERLRDGSVHIVKTRDAKDGSPVQAETVIDPSSWASVVATVSQMGETYATWSMILAFHGEVKGVPPDAPSPVPGGAPVRYDAGLDDAAYLEMLAEQRHEANYRAAHGLPPAEAAPGAGGEK